jgi:hypothetical protein
MVARARRVDVMQSISGMVLAGLCLVATACGQTPTPSAAPAALAIPRTATIAELLGPWHAEPLTLDLAMWSTVTEACRGKQVEQVPTLIDVRGESVAVVWLDDAAVSCSTIQIRPDGTADNVGGGSGGGPGAGFEHEVLPPLAPDELAVFGLAGVGAGSLEELPVEGLSIYGRTGPGIASVRVTPAGGPEITATMGDGWFGAWWPFKGGDLPLVVIRGYDASGRYMAEAVYEAG